MAPLSHRRRRVASLVASLCGAAVVAAVGGILTEASLARGRDGVRRRPVLGWIAAPVADSLTRLSFDLPFLFRRPAALPPACIVYLDEGAARELHQAPDAWDRRKHAELVRKLRADGASAVLFDIVFAGPSADAGADEEFAAAMKEHGRVYLGAGLELEESVGSEAGGFNLVQERVIPPTAVLRRAAAGWGLIAFRPVDADYGVRKMYPGVENVPAAAWAAALGLGAALPPEWPARSAPRWMSHYGPADTFPNVPYDRALAPDGPRDVFRGRLVVVGGRSTLGTLRLGKDDFRGPWSWIGGKFFHGPELHLTATMNLLRGEWLTRLPARTELGLALAVGLLFGAGLPRLRPHAAALVALLALALLAAAVLWLFTASRLWFAWAIPALVQLPLAAVWAIGARYFLEERRRRELRNAFAHYLSPHMADRIADADFDLSLGGKTVEATVLFTDLENFTGLSEELGDPQRLTAVLTTYFTRTTGHILEGDGTILKYLGDSVQAIWGAPLPDARHAVKAARAALRLHEAGRMEVLGHALRTRIGINTGPMIAGNLGSAQRFDYATTGDAVNFASRLEGMNKFLGTHILVSDSTAAQLGAEFALRCVGEFRVAGKKHARVIHELLGEGVALPGWAATFGAGLEAFRRGDFDAAERALRETIAQRGSDGPSTFYLEEIAAARGRQCGEGWTGVVELSAK